MSTWRVAWHLSWWKRGLIPLVPLCGFLTVQYKDPITWLVVLGIGGMLLAQESHSYRALRVLPLEPKEYAAAFWYVTMGPVVVLFPLGGLLAVAMHSMSIYDLASLVMISAIVTSAFGLMLTLSANPLLVIFIRTIVKPRQPYPSASIAFVAWAGVTVVCAMLMSMPERATESNAAWMPLNSLCLFLAPTLVVATYHLRERLFAAALYPASASTRGFGLGSRQGVIGANAAFRGYGFGQTHLYLAWGAVIWIAGAAVVAFALSGILPLRGAPFDLAAFTFYMSRLMLIVGLYPTICVASMAPLRTLRMLPLTCRQLVLRILGYFFVPWIPILPAVMALSIWNNHDWSFVPTFSLMYAGAGIVGIGISSFFEWSSLVGVIPVAFLAQLAMLVGLASTDMPFADNSAVTFIVLSITYAFIGIALLHHAIARSSRPYRAMRREEWG